MNIEQVIDDEDDEADILDKLEQSLKDLQKTHDLLQEQSSFEIYKNFIDKMFESNIVRTAVISVANLSKIKAGIMPIGQQKDLKSSIEIRDINVSLQNITDPVQYKNILYRITLFLINA